MYAEVSINIFTFESTFSKGLSTPPSYVHSIKLEGVKNIKNSSIYNTIFSL